MEFCKATCKNGALCKFNAKYSGYCKRHFKEPVDCPICLDKTSDFVTIQCNHVFHKSCITEWVTRGNRTCPVCRGKISNKTLTSIGIVVDTRIETIRAAEFYVIGYSRDTIPLLDRYKHILQTMIAYLQSEIMLRTQIIVFIQKRIQLKKGEKEIEKLQKEIDYLHSLSNHLTIKFTQVDTNVETIVKKMIVYMKRIHDWEHIA